MENNDSVCQMFVRLAAPVRECKQYGLGLGLPVYADAGLPAKYPRKLLSDKKYLPSPPSRVASIGYQ